MKKADLLYLIVFVTLTFSTINAQFTSVQSGGKWWYPSTWSTDPNATAIPDSTDDVIVNHDINLDASGRCKNLTINAAGRIHNGAVTVYGNLLNSGTIDGITEWYGMKINIRGNISNSGLYAATTDFVGTRNQTIESSDTLHMDFAHDRNPDSKIILEGVTIFNTTNLFLHGAELELKDSLILVNTELDGGKIIGNNNVVFGVGGRIGWSHAYSFGPAHTELTNLYLDGSIGLYGSGEDIWGLSLGEGVVNNGSIYNTYQHAGGYASIYTNADFINNGTISDQQDGLYINVKNGNITNNGEMRNRNITFINSHSFTNNSDTLSVLEIKGVDENSAVTINKDLLFNVDAMINMNGGKMILSNSAVLDGFGMENTILEANGSVISTRNNSYISLSTIKDIKAKSVSIAYYTNLFGEIEIVENGVLTFLNSRYGNIKGDITNNGTVTGRIDSTIIGNITNNGIWKAKTFLKGNFINDGVVSRNINIEIEGTAINNNIWQAETEVFGNVTNDGIIDSLYKFNVEGEITNNGSFNPMGTVILTGNIFNRSDISGGSFIVSGNIDNEGSWNSYTIQLNGTEDQIISMPTDSVLYADNVYYFTELSGTNYQWYRNGNEIPNENKQYLRFDFIGIEPDNATYYCIVDGTNSRNIIIQSLTDVNDEKDIDNEIQLPTEYSISQNYPNPFNPSTVIEFALPTSGNVSLKVFNSIGEEVAELVNKELNAGYHSVNFNSSNLSSGIYFYRISSGTFVQTNKMILLR